MASLYRSGPRTSDLRTSDLQRQGMYALAILRHSGQS